ncbi:hypothetical protein C8T65DRAFT_685161 [Cerioporus squamosus]|nr:hypothetical protein C8T65DRAFT_685161 [Cerioporus squamosus]
MTRLHDGVPGRLSLQYGVDVLPSERKGHVLLAFVVGLPIRRCLSYAGAHLQQASLARRCHSQCLTGSGRGRNSSELPLAHYSRTCSFQVFPRADKI